VWEAGVKSPGPADAQEVECENGRPFRFPVQCDPTPEINQPEINAEDSFNRDQTREMRNIMKRSFVLCCLLAMAVIVSQVHAQSGAKPKYAADVPRSVTTPDKVHTELPRDIEFFDGMPSRDRVRTAFDFLNFSRGQKSTLANISRDTTNCLRPTEAAGLQKNKQERS
jgi:hypothetical protein